MKTKTRKVLLAEIDELRQRLEKAEETLCTLQNGDTVPLKEITDSKNVNETLQHLASFPELNPNPVVEVDLSGNVYYLNPAAKQLFLDLQTIGPHHPWLSDLSSLAEMFKHQGKSSIIRELKINDSWYEQAIYYVSENNYIRIYGLDITEHKRTEQALHENEERLKRSQEIAHLGSWELNLVYNRLTWSDEVYQIFGLQPQEFGATYEAFLERVHPEDRAAVDAAYSGSLRENLDSYEIEHRVVRNDTGDIRVVHEKCEHFRDATGKIIRSVGMVHDITERKRAEEKLRKSRDELEIRVQERTTELANAYKELKEQSRILESFFKYTVTPLIFLDRDFNFIRVNEAYAKACQREVSEFPGHNHFEFYPSDAKKIFEQVVETRKPYQAIARPFTFPDHPEWGTTYWDWNLTPILDDAGEVESLVLYLEDVTKRKQAETQLKAGSLYARSLIEASLDPLVTINRDGKIMDVNRATELVTGFPREQLIGSDFSNYFTEPEKAREGYRQVFETGSVVRDYSLAIRHTAGLVTEVLYNATTYKNEAGEVQGIFAAARDITERKRAEEALRAASLYTRSLIEASLDPLVTISRDGKVMDVNSATELITGVPREQLIGSDFSDYFTEPEKAREGYQQVFKMGSVRDYPLSIRHTSGHITDVLYHATPYRNETGEVQGAFAAARDITKRKRAEDALKESENRLRHLSSQLLTVQENERKRIAREIHDGIGQILTAIKFKVEDITQQMSKGKVYVKEKSLEPIIPLIQESIEEVRRIQMDLRPSTLDDLGILATTDWFCREFEKIYSTIHIEKLINIHENEVPAHLRTAIFRVVQEALNNIAKHSKADLIHLSLQKTDDTIELAIQDNGQGFNLMEVLSVEGSKRGLGLTSMRERTELSGGSFVVESTRGRGTVIRALWPTG